MHIRVNKLLLFLSLLFPLLAITPNIWAVSLSPELVAKLKAEGRLQEVASKALSAREKGVWQPNLNLLLSGKGISTGQVDTVRAIAILVDFDDRVHTRLPEEFDDLLFSKGFVYPKGSMRDFYWENSYGTFELIGEVVGWYRMPQDNLYYTCLEGEYGFGPYPYNAQKLVEDAVLAADPDVNFADYDGNGDGLVDALFVIHAGPGAEESGSVCHIWSHRWTTYDFVPVDGVNVYDYSTEPETRSGGELVDMGVFAHEFGHVLGLPDLYDYDYSSEGAGNWSLMAGGSWNNNGDTPAHMDAFSKYKLGFSSVNQLSSNLTDVEILQAETSPVAYRLWTSGAGGSEYFLVENRQITGFDRYLPGDGLLIWHVDESAWSNDDEWCPGDPAEPHYRVALEQADGRYGLEGCYNPAGSGDAGDPFPGYYDKMDFDDSTLVNSKNYYGYPTQVAAWNIGDSDSAMYVNLDVTWSRPGLYLDEFTLDDMSGGDGDGYPENGETITLYFTISNIWLPLDGTTITAFADTEGIVFTDDYSSVGYLGTGGSVNNYGDPIEFEIDPLFPGRPTVITLRVEGNGGSYSYDLEVKTAVGSRYILIVDQAGKYQSYYTSALDSLEQIYDIWEAYAKADPDFSFSQYKCLIWYTGDHQTDLFTPVQVESLISFLDNGGRLFLTSQDAVECLANSADPLFQTFMTDYLHVGYGGNNTEYFVAQQPGDEIGHGLWIYPGGYFSPNNQTSKDNLIPDSETDTVLVYSGVWWEVTDLVAGTKFMNDFFRVVVFGYGFEGISTSTLPLYGIYLSKPHLVMQRVLDWFKGPGPSIKITSPNGGERWVDGEIHDILWESTWFHGSVKIEYSTDAGNSWLGVVDTSAGNGIFSWTVPETPSDSCLLRISDTDDGLPVDESDAVFCISNFYAGDPNGDRVTDLGDAIYLLNYLFKEGSVPDPTASGDVNADCSVNLSDAIYLLNYLFKEGDPPQLGCA